MRADHAFPIALAHNKIRQLRGRASFLVVVLVAASVHRTHDQLFERWNDSDYRIPIAISDFLHLATLEALENILLNILSKGEEGLLLGTFSRDHRSVPPSSRSLETHSACARR